MLRAAVAVVRAMAVFSDTADAVITGLAGRTRASSVPADTGVISAAGVAVRALAVVTTLMASSIATVSEVTGAARSSRARAVTVGKPGTANVFGERSVATRSAQSSAAGCVTGTLTCR